MSIDWPGFFVGLFIAGLVGILALIAILIFRDSPAKPLIGAIIASALVIVGATVGLKLTAPPSTVEQLDNTKCSMYVWRGKWDCVPWDQAG